MRWTEWRVLCVSEKTFQVPGITKVSSCIPRSFHLCSSFGSFLSWTPKSQLSQYPTASLSRPLLAGLSTK